MLVVLDARRFTHHTNNLRVHGFGENASTVRNIHGQIVEGGPLDLLALQIGHGVHEVERDAALSEFANEELLLLLAGTFRCAQPFRSDRDFRHTHFRVHQQKTHEHKPKPNSPLSGGNCCSSTSCELRYLDEPCDFLLFFFSDRFANGSMRSTNVPDDIVLGVCLCLCVCFLYR